MFISNQSKDTAGLELLFVEVDELSAWFAGDLNPSVSVSNEIVKWMFCDSISTVITSKSMYYRFLGNDTWGKDLRYSWQDVFMDRN